MAGGGAGSLPGGRYRVNVRVLIVDDQAAVREGLVTLLELAADIDVVGAAADGERAVALAAEHRPDVVLMDLHMPGMDGATATRLITDRHPDTHVVVLTTYADDGSILGALSAGALGYLTKDAGRAEIARAVHAAANNQAVLDPHVQRRLLAAARAGGGAAAHRPSDPPDGLTAREAEVLGLIAAGLSNAEIATRLFIGEATVKTHINHLFAKTGVRDRAQAVQYAYQNGLAEQ